VWNIGAEGQLIVGALAGGVVALQASPEASQLYMIWVILAAMVGGGVLQLPLAPCRKRAPENR